MSIVLKAFTEAELQQYQVGELSSALPNNLNNPIHPIYFRNQWDGCPDDVYEILTPSIRLASLMVNSPASLIFYDALTNKAGRRYQRALSDRLGKPCYEFHSFDPEIRNSAEPQILREVSEEIAGKAEHIRWRLIENDARVTNFFAVTRRERVFVKNDVWTVGTTSTISFGMDNVTSLRRLGAHGSVSQLLRQQFHVAITLAHELVHAIENSISLESYEPYFQDQRIAELGLAWEQAVFGGRVTMLSNIENPLGLVKWPTAWKESQPEQMLQRRLPKRTCTVYLVPMIFASNIQQPAFWAQALDWNSLKIPKRHGLQLPGHAPFDPTWVKEESSEGRHPGDAQGKVHREDLDDNWETLERPADEFQWDDFDIQLPPTFADDEDVEITQDMIDALASGTLLDDIDDDMEL